MISTKVKKIVQHAFQTVPFYMNLVRENSFHLDDWLDIPVTEKMIWY